jgi:endonuclease YncB( thermonuclease family)
LVRIVDGDTQVFDIDLGFSITREDEHIRLYAVDTAEKYGVKKGSKEYLDGVEATKFVEEWFATNGTSCIIQTHPDKHGRDRRGSLRRYLAIVVSAATGRVLNDDIETAGLDKIQGSEYD